MAEGGGAVLRGGTLTGSTYGFAGLGMAGLDMLAAAAKEVGLPVVTQVAAPGDVEAVSDRVDMLEVGAGNMQDFELLRAVGSSGKPVLLRRGPSATIDEWLWAAEYVLAGGNDQVVLVERGIRTFGDHGMTLDIGAIPMVKERSHLPVLVDPSGPAGWHQPGAAVGARPPREWEQTGSSSRSTPTRTRLAAAAPHNSTPRASAP